MPDSVTDVAFVFPPAQHEYPVFAEHLGVAYLRTALAHAGINTRQYVTERPGSGVDVAHDLLAFKPKIVGFTAYDANFPLCLLIARYLKQRCPGIINLFGGPTATFGAAELLSRHPAIDFCVTGETEETGPQLFAALLDGKAPTAYPGLAYRSEDNIICNPDPPLVGATAPDFECALDSSPSPYLAGILQSGRAGVLTARGCNHDCQYCSFAVLGRRKLRLHSIERVVSELEVIAALRRRRGEQGDIHIQDDAFTVLPSRAKELCQAIIDRSLNLTFACLTRADTVDDELLQLMWAAGFRTIGFGLESAVPSVLRACGKVRPPGWHNPDLSPERQFLDRLRHNVVSSKAIGFRVIVSTIFGLPTETPEDGEATLKFLRELPIDDYSHNLLVLHPGTPLWEARHRYGMDAVIDALGIAETRQYAYDVNTLRPGPKCSLENRPAFCRAHAIEALGSCASPVSPTPSISTVVIRVPILTPSIASWLSDILDVGGVVLQVYPADHDTEDKNVRKKDRSVAHEYLVPFRHYIQADELRRSNGVTEYLLDCSGLAFYRAHDPRAVTIRQNHTDSPLLAWCNGKQVSCDLCEGTPLSDYLGTFRRGCPSDSDSWAELPCPPALRYPGRWIKDYTCGSLAHLEVDSSLNVRCCTLAHPIGRVGDTRQSLRACFLALRAAAETRRGCNSCSQDDCPRCPFPGMDDQPYCHAMTQSKAQLKILQSVHLYSRLPLILAREADRAGAG